MQITFHNLQDCPPAWRRVPSAKKFLIHDGFEQFLKKCKSDYPGSFMRPRVLSFYVNKNPELIGFVVHVEPEMNNNDEVSELILTHLSRSDVRPLRIATPSWLRGFRGFACFLDEEMKIPYEDKNYRGLLLEAFTSASLEYMRCYAYSERQIALAYKMAPIGWKLGIISMLRFRLFDPKSEEFLTEKAIDLRSIITAALRTPGRALFYAKKVDLCDLEILKKMAQMHYIGGLTLIIDYNSAILCSVFEKTAAIGGCGLFRMTANTPVQQIADNVPVQLHSGPLTRKKQRTILCRELSWTIGYLYSEGRMEKAEFLEVTVASLQCPFCEGKMKKYHKLHVELLRHKAYLRSAEIRRELHPENELLWWKKKKCGSILCSSDNNNATKVLNADDMSFFRKGLTVRNVQHL